MNRKNNIRYLMSAVVPLLPFLNMYALPFVNAGVSIGINDAAVVMLVALSLFMNFRQKRARIRRYSFIVYFTVYFILSILFILLHSQKDISNFVTQWLKLIVFYYCVDFISPSQLDKAVLQKWIVVVGVVSSAFLIIQFAAAKLFSIEIDLLVPFLQPRQVNIVDVWERHFASGGWRPTSFYAEPAHFSQVVLLSLAITLFSSENTLSRKKKTVYSLLITMALFFAKSANGMIITVIQWGIWILHNNLKKIPLRKILIAVLAVLFVVLFLAGSEYAEFAINRLEGLVLGYRNGEGTSGTLRVLQGFAVYGRLPLFEKLFGVGFGNISAYITEHGITTQYIRTLGNEYMNGFSQVLVSSGAVGFAWFIYLWCRMFFDYRDMAGRVALLTISIFFCTSSMFLSSTTIVYLVYICCPWKRAEVQEFAENSGQGTLIRRNGEESKNE